MKKNLLLIVACVICLHSYSQDKLVKYQGEVALGYSFDVGVVKGDKVNLQMINGVRVGQYFAVGVGVGLDYLEGSYWGFSTFGNLKGYLPVCKKTDLFISTDIGGGWGKANDFGRRNGVIVAPALGASFRVTPHSAINVSLIYTHQGLGKNRGDSNANYDALGIKVGFQF